MWVFQHKCGASLQLARGEMRSFLTASSQRVKTRRNVRLPPTYVSSCCGGDGHWREGAFELLLVLHPRGSLSTATAATGGGGGGGGRGVRKRMMPLIKLVHPDMFARYPSDIASTNSKSLKDLNTLIDAAEALEPSAAGFNPATSSGGVSSPAPPPTVDPFYSLTFFHHQPEQKQNQHPPDGGDNDNESADSSALLELRAELRFPPALSSDPSGSLRRQLNRQLDGLLKRVSVNEGGVGGQGAGDQGQEDVLHGDGRGRIRAMREGVRVREGETEDDFYGEAFGKGGWGTPPRDGIRTERASKSTNRGQGRPRMTSEELRKLTLEHAGDNHHVNPWDAGAGSGFLGGGVGGRGRRKGGFGRFGGEEAAAQARSRRVDDLLRSGRVQFAGVPVAREASTLLNLHRTLVKHFEHLELNDRGLWSTVVIVLRARSDKYEVQVHSSGPVLVIPEKFSERNLVRFLSEVLLSSHG